MGDRKYSQIHSILSHQKPSRETLLGIPFGGFLAYSEVFQGRVEVVQLQGGSAAQRFVYATAPYLALRFNIFQVYIHVLRQPCMADKNAGVTVGVYKTEQEAQRGMEDCQRDDFMLDSARSLVNAAVEAYMRMHDIDREAAHEWIREAAG